MDDSFDDVDMGGGGFDDDEDSFTSAHPQMMGVDDCVEDVNDARMLAPDRRVGKIRVHHETRAKKVDVKVLKEQIWDEIG